MPVNLTKNTKIIRHSNAVAVGVTVITPSTAVDTDSFESCTFIAAFGAIVAGAATSIEVHQSAAAASGFTALLGSKVTVGDGDDDKLAFVEVTRPRKRYLKLVVNRATQNATLDGIIALLSSPKIAPVSHDATVLAASELHVSPAEGTA